MSLIKQTKSKPTEFTVKEFAGYQIKQLADGYLNATEMCKVEKKEWSNYKQNNQSKEYLNALNMSLGIPANLLIQSITIGLNENRGTWVHPKVAIHLAMWISPSFAVQVTDWVYRFLSGDISLVKDVVDRHDAINNTESKIFIETQNKQLNEYRNQINELNITTNKLKSKIEDLHKLSCPYCNRSYSSTNGLTNHINNKCEEKQKQKFLAIININKFMKYINLLTNNWDDRLKKTFEFTMKKLNWNSDKPKLVIKYHKNKKQYTYQIYRNSSRAIIIDILNNKRTLPINLLVDASYLEMFDNNSKINTAIRHYEKYGSNLFADEFEDLLNDANNEVGESDNESDNEYDNKSDNNEPISWINQIKKIPDNNNKYNYDPYQLISEKYKNINIIPGLKLNLFPHQKPIIKAMIDLENNRTFELYGGEYKIQTNCGILSEQVGSGKTIEILALILAQQRPKAIAEISNILYPFQTNSGFIYRKKFKYVLKPTIIFVGVSVIKQWEHAINNFTNLKVYIVKGIFEFESLINKIITGNINSYQVVLIKNGMICRSVLPDKIIPYHDITNPYMYELIANIKNICWSRVILDDFDTIKLPTGANIINALFTWYISATCKKMKAKQLDKCIKTKYTNTSDLLLYGNYDIGSMLPNQLLYNLFNIRNDPKFVEKTNLLSCPKIFAYKFINNNKQLITAISSLIGSDEMNDVVEMLNADAIETAAERLGIKTSNTAEIFEKLLGDQYNNLKYSNQMLLFIKEQMNREKDRLPWNENCEISSSQSKTYGLKRAYAFEPINYQYPGINKFLSELKLRYTGEKAKSLNILQRISNNIKEGDCPICMLELGEEASKIVIFKCCNLVMCQDCCFQKLFMANNLANCVQCRREINLKSLIYINTETIELNKIVNDIKDVEDGKSLNNIITEEIKPIRPNIPILANKYDIIMEIINNEVSEENQIPVNVHIEQLMGGPNILPEGKEKKVLIFANYDETLKKICQKLNDEKIDYEQLGGTYKQIQEIAHRFSTSPKHNILLINSIKHCSGLNLQTSTDLIFAHLITDNNIEAQVAGRGQRLGRVCQLNIHYMLYEDEFNNHINSGKMSLLN